MLCKNVMPYCVIFYILYWFIISNISADLSAYSRLQGTQLAKDDRVVHGDLHWGWGNEMEQVSPSGAWRTKKLERHLSAIGGMRCEWTLGLWFLCPKGLFSMPISMNEDSFWYRLMSNIFPTAAEAAGKIWLIQDVTSEANSHFCELPYAPVQCLIKGKLQSMGKCA